MHWFFPTLLLREILRKKFQCSGVLFIQLFLKTSKGSNLKNSPETKIVRTSPFPKKKIHEFWGSPKPRPPQRHGKVASKRLSDTIFFHPKFLLGAALRIGYGSTVTATLARKEPPQVVYTSTKKVMSPVRWQNSSDDPVRFGCNLTGTRYTSYLDKYLNIHVYIYIQYEVKWRGKKPFQRVFRRKSVSIKNHTNHHSPSNVVM